MFLLGEQECNHESGTGQRICGTPGKLPGPWLEVVKDGAPMPRHEMPLGTEVCWIPNIFKSARGSLCEVSPQEHCREAVGLLTLGKVAPVLVAHGLPKLPKVRLVSGDQFHKWMRKFELSSAFLKQFRCKFKRRDDKAELKRNLRLEQLRGSVPLRTASEAHVSFDSSECGIELLQFLRNEASKGLNAPGLFDAKPSKVMYRLGEVQTNGSSPLEILKLRPELCLLSTRTSSLTSISSALKCWSRFAVTQLGYA